MIADVRLPYEILIRFDETGSPKGAHVQYRQRLIIDGVVRADDILPAAPLSLDNMPASDLMTDATRDALIAVASRDGEIGALTAKVTRLQSELDRVAADLQEARGTAAMSGDDNMPATDLTSGSVGAVRPEARDPVAPGAAAM